MSQYSKTMTSFSGADLIVAFGNKVIGELQSISWGIQRKKAPVYTLGSADARSFSRSVRGIAGSMTFATFDRDALIEEVTSAWAELDPGDMFTAAGNLVTVNNDSFANAIGRSGWDKVNAALKDADGGNEQWNKETSNAFKSKTDEAPAGFSKIGKNNIVYADMLPPFDATMTFANEYGQAAFQKIYDMDILNEGSGVSVDSIVMERQMTFVARRISPLIKGVYNREVKK